jgi:hypothetical protein
MIEKETIPVVYHSLRGKECRNQINPTIGATLEATVESSQFNATSSVDAIHNTLKGDKAYITVNTLLATLRKLNHSHLPYIEQALQADPK